MTCSACSSSLEKSLLKLDGITKVKVSLKGKTATIYSSVSIPDEDIIDTINTSNIFRESKRNASIKIIGEKCIVSINPKTKNLIQVNPK